jgi:hypothetical protein
MESQMTHEELLRMKRDMDDGIMLSKSCYRRLLDHALNIEDQSNQFAKLIVEQMAPLFVTDDNGPDGWACQCCSADAKGGPDERPILVHDSDCTYLKALSIHSSS